MSQVKSTKWTFSSSLWRCASLTREALWNSVAMTRGPWIYLWGLGSSSRYLKSPKRNHTCLHEGCRGQLNTKCLCLRQPWSCHADDYVDGDRNDSFYVTNVVHLTEHCKSGGMRNRRNSCEKMAYTKFTLSEF